MAYFTLLLVLLGTIGGAISYEANAALPGDPLYVYKISVNEEIEKFVANTDESRARWDLYTLTERLKEAQVLAQHDHLDAVAQTEVTHAINEHVRSLTATINRFQQSNNNDAAVQVASNTYDTLSAQEKKIASASSLGSASLQIELAPVLVTLRTSLATMSLISTKAHARTITDTHLADATITSAPDLQATQPSVRYFR